MFQSITELQPVCGVHISETADQRQGFADKSHQAGYSGTRQVSSLNKTQGAKGEISIYWNQCGSITWQEWKSFNMPWAFEGSIAI